MPALLAVLTVLLQVAYPLTNGTARDRLTVATVVAFLAASLAHATAQRGAAWASSYLALVVGVSLAAEAVGVATGVPFGSYAYTGSLGPQLLGVPVVVPLAWAMIAYPCLLLGPVRGALCLAAWDVFLDPQMVDAGHWHWLDVQVGMPFVPEVPVSNTLGWLLVAGVLMTVLSRLPRLSADDRLPRALLLWTWASSVLADLAFFGRPGVALTGGLAMGLCLLPQTLLVRR